MAMSQASFTTEQEQLITQLSSAADLLLRRTCDGLEGSPIVHVPTVTHRRPTPRVRSGVFRACARRARSDSRAGRRGFVRRRGSE